MWVPCAELAAENSGDCVGTLPQYVYLAPALQISISPTFHSAGDQAIKVADAGLSISATTGEASGPWVAPRPSPSG